MLGVAVGFSAFARPNTQDRAFSLDVIDLDADKRDQIVLGFLGHGFARSPRAPHRAAVFEKKGPGGAFVDLSTRELLRPIETSSARRAFYGHGVYSADGASLFAVETDRETRQGFVVVRDPESFDVLGDFPSHGESPHDCLLVDEGRTLALTNGGGALGSTEAPSVTFVDVASARLLERMLLLEPRINAGHLAVTARGAVAVASAPRDGLPELTSTGGVSFGARGGRLSTMKKPPAIVRRMLGEALSVSVHEPSSIAAITHPAGDLVTFWDLGSQRLVRSWDVASPRGVMLAAGGGFFAVSHGAEATLSLVSTATLEVEARRFGARRASGSHLYLLQP